MNIYDKFCAFNSSPMTLTYIDWNSGDEPQETFLQPNYSQIQIRAAPKLLLVVVEGQSALHSLKHGKAQWCSNAAELERKPMILCYFFF